MADERDRDEDREDVDDDPEREDADEESSEEQGEDGGADADEPDEAEEPEERSARRGGDREPDEDDDEDRPPRRKKARASRAGTSDRKKAAERKKAGERPKGGGERRRRSAESRRGGESRRRRTESRRRRDDDRRPAESTRREESRRRRSRRDEEERPPARRRRRSASSKRRKREPEPAIVEIREPVEPPEPDVDLSAPLEPAWDQGLIIGAVLVLVSVGLAVGSLLTSPGQSGSFLPVVGLSILLLATTAGGFGILARRSWGYVLGLGSAALGIAVGLLWTLYVIVSPPVTIWRVGLPLGWFVCNVLAVLVLYQMRWGPGPMAGEQDRLRSLKLRTLAYTTMHGEFAYAGAIAALLGSLLALTMLLGAGQERPERSQVAQFADGMELERFDQPPDEGTLVLARWGSEVYFFLGRVDDRRGEDEIHIAYLDGDQEWVDLDDLRHDTVRAEAIVHVHVQGHEGWLPARVTQRTGDRVEVDLGSRRVWVPLAMVRVREL